MTGNHAKQPEYYIWFPSIKARRGGYWHFAFALAISRVLVLDLVVLVVVGFNV